MATNLTNTVGYTEGAASVALTDIVVSDPDAGDTITATLTLTDPATGALTTSGAATYAAGTGVWTITGTPAEVNAALAAVAFVPTRNNDVVTTITTQIRDEAGNGPTDGMITLDVTPVNDRPRATNLTNTCTYTEGDSSVALKNIVVKDVDTGESITATLTLANPAAGVLTTSGTATYSASTGVWTITGTLAQVNAALAAVAFNPAANNDVDTTITTRIRDAAGTGPKDGTITLDVTPAPDTNSAPLATNLTNTVAYTEGAASVALTDIVVSDPDAGDTITATLTLTNPATGALTTSGTATYTVGTGVWTITGTLAEVNAALAAVAFNPATNNDVDTTITTRIRDAAGTGPTDGLITLDVTPASATNEVPLATNLTNTVAYTEGAASVALSEIVVSDPDAGDTITATLTLTNPATGALTSSGTATYSAGTGVWTITGTLAEVNAALAAVAFNPATNNDVDTTITTQIRDAAGTGPADGTITLDVTPVNDAPTVTGALPSMNSISADATAPVGAVGTLVADLVNLVGGGGLNNITDVDGSGLGIAVTTVNTTIGTWHYSTDGGTNWFSLGTPTATSARLLSADSDTRIYLDPNGSATGPQANVLSFRIWDETSGVEGNTFNVTSDDNNQFTSSNSSVGITINAVGGGGPVVTFNSSTLNGTNGFLLLGAASGDQTGKSVAAIGDFNGDGFGDIVVGSPGRDVGAANAGQAAVIFGTANSSPLNLLPLGSMNGSTGFELNSNGANLSTGQAVGNGGDANGDGLADAFVGTPGFLLIPTGEAALVFGRADSIGALDNAIVQNFNPTSGLFPTNGGLVLDGPASPAGEANGSLGFALDTSGDFNGDGLADMVIGAPNTNPAGTSSTNAQGQVFVVMGRSSGIANVDPLSGGTLGSTAGFNVNGGAAGDQAGFSVRYAGDVDGDGFDDILVGAPGKSGGVGETYLLWGRASGFPDNIDLSSIAVANGIKFSGVDLDGRLGAGVAGLGDINGDGLADFAFTAPTANPRFEQVASGRTYVVFGNTNRSTLNSINLGNLNGTTGFMLEGGKVLGSIFGATFSGDTVVGRAGDVNGDGFDDIVIGTPSWVNQLSGQAYIVYGHAGNFAAQDELNLGSGLNGTNGFTILGSSTTNGDKFGGAVAGGIDFNGDGYKDFIIGAESDNGTGTVAVVLGENFRNESTAAKSLTASANGQNLAGGLSADTLDANGFDNISIHGGRGDDTIRIQGNETGLRIDGGTGTDSLEILGSGRTLDLSSIPNNRITNIEQIDLSGSGNNTLTLDVLDLLALSETSNTLWVFGNAGDVINASSSSGSWSNGGVAGGVHTYTLGQATLLVDDVVTQVIT